MFLNLFYITVICVIITDVLHFWEEFSPYLKSWLSGGKFKTPIRFKLFECSTCQSHWLNLLYIIVIGRFTIFNYMVILLLAISTPIINDLIQLTIGILRRLFGWIGERIDL